jgi:uncharacterized coiled-coil protein SlyX
MEEEKIEEKKEEGSIEEMAPLESPPGFKWGQIVLAIGVVIALILASWNAFSIMETDKEMSAEDAELSDDIRGLNASLGSSIDNLDNNMSAQMSVLDGKISDLDDRLTQEKTLLIDMIDNLNSTLQSEIDSLQSRVSVLEGNITELNNDINNMQTDIQGLQDQLDALKGRVTNLEQACDFDDDGIFDRYDEDDDNDGFLDTEDTFPHNATEWADNDGDGTGDNTDTDDDNDGYPDSVDLLPYKDAKVKVTVISFTLEDTNDDVFFMIYVDWGHPMRSPVFWDCPNGWEYTVNWECEYNVPDDTEIVTIDIDMLDEDIDLDNDYLDIEGKSASFWLYLDYNIVTGEWSGDDDDGYSSGFDDGRAGESDVLFSYNIETV